ncbi:MAG: hypothetical protein R6V47_02335 [Candidatus Delongbacteria bacterium]
MEKCGKIETMILEGSLSIDIAEEKDAKITEHTKICMECRNKIEEMQKVRSYLKNIKKLKVSPEFNNNLRSRLESVRSGVSEIKLENTNRKTVPFFTRVAYYGAGIAAVIVGMLFFGGREIFNENNDHLLNSSSNSAVIANADRNETPVKNITDSLENLKDPVKDENLRKSVSTGE